MKKFTNKFLAILMCLTMILTIAPLSGIVPLVSAATYSGSCGEDLTWTLDTETGVLEISGEGDMTNWHWDIDYAPWYYSYRSNVKTVNIGDNVTNIGSYAFYNCYNLTSITISNSVTSIGDSAFYNTAYYNDDSNWTDGVLYIGNHLIDVKATISGAYTIKPGTKTIADYAFEYCRSLTSVTIGNSVTSIGDYAFYNCDNLTDVYYEGSKADWEKISIGADNSNLTSNLNFKYYSGVCGENLTWTLDTETGVLEITGTGDMTSSAPWYSYWLYIKTVNIGDSVTSIGNYAFAECHRLTSAMIPDSVTSIGVYAFAYCDGLTSITIPGSVASIGDSAFYRCTGLTSITIPDSVTSIASSAFYDTAYYNDDSNWTDGVLYIGNHLIKAKTTISGAYTIKLGTKIIANSAFYYCDSLIRITIPDSVTSIGDSAFSGCESLTSITIPDSVESIGARAFENCYLTDIVIGKSVKSIGNYAFRGCFLLEDVFYAGSKDDWNKINIGIVNSILTGARIHYNSSSVHSYVERILQPTCTEDGYKLCVCECDNVYIEEHIDALGHSYKNGVCINCGKTTGGISVPDNSSVVIDKEKGLISGLDMSLDKDGLMQYLEISDDVTLTLSTDIIGTGTVITISDKATGNILETYTAVIFGDYNGDGVADIEDTGYFSSISNFEIFDYFENEYLFMAADINGDGVVDSMDEEDMYAVANYDAYIDFTITSGSKVIRY